jgi:hypothetical protein
MSHLASCSTLYRNQSNALPPIQSRDSPSSYQGITLPSIQFRDGLLAGQPRVQWQGHNSQQLQPSAYIEPRSPLPIEEGRRTLAPTWKSGRLSILNPNQPMLRFQNGPDIGYGSPLSAVDPVPPSTSIVHTFSSQEQLSNTSPRADGNAATLARGARTILTSESPSQANAQKAAIFEDAGSLPLSPASEGEYKANPGPFTSSLKPTMPTPPTQFNEQQYESTSSSRYLTDALYVSETTKQAPVRTLL